jgi:Acyl-CoA dehydrogenase, C-terminal domain
MDPTDFELLDSTVRTAITQAVARDPGVPVDDIVVDLGWHDMLAAASGSATTSVFRALGVCGASASLLDDVLLRALDLELTSDVAVVLPEFGSIDLPGRHGLATARATKSTHFVVAGAHGATAMLAREEVAVSAASGIDPEFGLHRVELLGAAANATRPPPTTSPWSTAIAAGQRAIAHQTLGACQTMLGMARTHALEREQFGRSIARFQAVRHRLADTLVAIETLAATLDVEPVRADVDDRNLLAALAKATAGRTARTVAAHCQQILAGIGFTTDHDFHRFAKRTLVLDGLLGSCDTIVRALGQRCLETRVLPELIDL